MFHAPKYSVLLILEAPQGKSQQPRSVDWPAGTEVAFSVTELGAPA